jgi:quinol monooxygenase YgiN
MHATGKRGENLSESRELTSRRDFIKATGAAGVFAASIGFVRPAAAAAEDTWITQLASFKLNMAKETEAIASLRELCAGVEEHEPGVLAYICHRSVNEPEKVVFFEIYKDQAAVEAHGTTPHMGKLRTAFATQFLPPLEIKRLDRVSGFSR